MKNTLSLLIVGFSFLSLSLAAQEVTETPTTQALPDSLHPFQHKQAAGIILGMGLGAEYAFQLNDHFTIGARATLLPLSYEGYEYEVDGEMLLMDFELNWVNADLYFDYHPFKKRNFKLVAGASYAINNYLGLTMRFTEDIERVDFNATPEDIGYIKILPTWAKFRPYAGLGFGRKVSNKKKLGFNFEMGAYYGGSPDVDIEATKMLTGTEQEASTLERNMEQLKFLPYGAICIVYRF